MRILKTAKYKKAFPEDDGFFYIIVDEFDDSAVVYQYKENTDRSSVRFGLMDNIYVEDMPSLEMAKQKYPQADVRDTKIPPDDMPMHPPDDFDYYDAGEYWSENDY